MAELVRAQDKIASVRDLLTKMVPQLALAVGTDVTAKRLARIATTSVLRNPRLLECDPKTLAGAVMECAQIGLEPDGREAHLVPFRNNKRGVYEVQLIPDYKGLAKLSRNSGQVKTLDWREVRKGDAFEYKYGSTAMLVHVPSPEPIHSLVPKDPKKPDGEKVWIERPITHCYSLAVLEGGESVFEVMNVTDVEWHRDRYSRAAGDGPWTTNFDAMGAKTCFRKLSKKLPRASHDDRLGRAVELDEKGEQGIPQELGGDLIGTDGGDGAATTGAPPDAPTPTSKLDKLTGELKNGKTNGGGEAKSTGAGFAAGTTEPATSAPVGESDVPPTETTKDVRVPEQEAAPQGSTAPPATPKSSAVTSVGGTPEPHPLDEPKAKLMAAINALYKALDLLGDKKRPMREFLWTRFVGATPEHATVEKMEKLKVELEGQLAMKQKK